MRGSFEPDGGRPDQTIGESTRAGGAAALKLYQARFELLLLDLEEEKERLEQRLILSCVTGVLLAAGSLLVTAFLVALLWPTMGPWAIALFAILFFGAGGAVFAFLRRLNRDRHATFACTLDEFEKDAKCFAGMLHEPQANWQRERAPVL